MIDDIDIPSSFSYLLFDSLNHFPGRIFVLAICVNKALIKRLDILVFSSFNCIDSFSFLLLGMIMAFSFC
jgi:hypothetical protein